MINIDKAFNTENRSIYEYFQQPGVGFYIPLYQREYSWDASNIEQLLEDIAKGIEELTDESQDNQIRFLGTIITVTESDKNNIQPQDTKALPPAIEKVIDGQQRLSTISLMSALLYKQILSLEERLEKSVKKLGEGYDKDELISEVREACNSWKVKLQAVFGVDLTRGTPPIKPKIIRGNLDKWVMKEASNSSYLSQIAFYLYEFIEHFFNNGQMPSFDKETNAGRNLKIVQSWLNKTVAQAHLDSSEFCDAVGIINRIDGDNLWQYERISLREIVEGKDTTEKNSFGYHLSSLVQTFAVCHYLLDRCCFTVIKPANDDWAFDMFQSLNATGTPLTSIETFMPLVVQTVSTQFPSESFKETLENAYFMKIGKAFENLSSAAQKSKLTNEILTSLALPVAGQKLATHFSAQKKWLEAVYNGFKTYEQKREFVKFFGNYTEFYDEVWNKFRAKDNYPLAKISSSNEAELASILLLFLKESNHKMAITFLGSFYHKLAEGELNSVSDFVSIIKAVAAFYILWRSAIGNSGLDDVYRTYFRGYSKDGIPAHNLLIEDNFNLDEIKAYLKSCLPYPDKKSWLDKSSSYCGYVTSYSICKFALRNAAHETIPDESRPGLYKKAAAGTSNYLRIEKWTTLDLNSIEHIAPDKSKGDWDANLYGEDEIYNFIGNLTLLPKGVNTSASNKGWNEKLLYYRHLSEKDLDKLQELTNRAIAEGIPLAASTLEILKNSNYSDHIAHILTLDETSEWNAKIVKARSRKIMESLWDKVYEWLN